MAERHIDVLLMQTNNDFMGGYVRYFTGLPATNGYPVTVVFPRDDDMTVIGMGPFGMDRRLAPGEDSMRPGVRRLMGGPSFATAAYTMHDDAELAERALEGFVGATVGLLATASLPHAFVERLRRGRLSNTRFVDASDFVDAIKAVKSPEEIERMRATAALQDAAMQAVFKAAQPGMREIELTAIAEQVGHGLGSEQGLFLAASAPSDHGVPFANRHLQNRTLQAGDQLTILIESNGGGGFYCELGRTCVLGEATAAMKDEFELALAARRLTLARLKPGAACGEIWDAYNGFLRDRGRPEEKRIHCHGQGYDMVERPLVRFDETMPIQAGMVLSCHPAWLAKTTYSWICDNYLIREDDPPERLHRFPERIFELG
ncbi:MAG: aminopeptidase P family protein [Alphaproteobacteria bacterium]|nr:aminopeptidase P family protein [Alphaproteobacteria bacterium]